jgi:hypothetical protein
LRRRSIKSRAWRRGFSSGVCAQEKQRSAVCVCVCVCIVEYMRISEHALSSERTLLSHALLYADASACSYADASACSSLAERTLLSHAFLSHTLPCSYAPLVSVSGMFAHGFFLKGRR